MKIKFIEIQNFRKLKSCRIELSEQKTVFVGANNSGKTSSMDALIKFLTGKNKFTINDITISNWVSINAIGNLWENEVKKEDLSASVWTDSMPALDIWIEVTENEVHHITHLLPTLDWDGEAIGIRLLLEPKNNEYFYKDYHEAFNNASKIISTAQEKEGEKAVSLKLWPKDMRDFLDRKLENYFNLRAYILDPIKLVDIKDGNAFPQKLPDNSEPIQANPFKGLIRIDCINAQRGFSDPDVKTENDGENPSEKGNLSTQLRNYYDKHINPEELPDIKDIDALQAIGIAQGMFDEKLKDGFKDAISELEEIGYPGFTDPLITISSKIKPIDTLKHNSAVQFDVIKDNPDCPKLPERYNGLGYQNLISMVFKLMRFRDDWMLVGKAAKEKAKDDESYNIPPLHLVLIEEPEAHLHAQVQQVFIRKAYSILRNHKRLGTEKNLTTQLVVSTHSSNIAHAVDFADLRYFRRKPANQLEKVPTSTVVNLSEVFGKDDDTAKFATRYLKSTHCDLFFADAAILIEGPAERMLLPHFIESKYPKLNESYISVLEIGGSHAHRMKPLIEHLGLITLIITDLDSAEFEGHHKSSPPIRGRKLITNNSTLKDWVPKVREIDELLDLSSEDKITGSDTTKYIRVAYQIPKEISINSKSEEALSSTFEDSLLFHNLDVFKNITGESLLMKEFSECVKSKTTASELEDGFYEALNKYGSKKAEFALELLFSKEPQSLEVPNYISEGLDWLCGQLEKKQKDIVDTEVVTNQDVNSGEKDD